MTSTLASQSKLADLTSKFDGKTPGKYIIATEFYLQYVQFSSHNFLLYFI